MLTGKSSGTGKFSFQTAHKFHRSCQVTLMPEDTDRIRIAFTDKGEVYIPVMKLSIDEAEMLWSALNRMAIDLNFKDYKSNEELS